MAKTSVYIDGFNLYHAIDALDRPHLKWVNLRTIAESFLRPADEILSIFYFSAYMKWHPEKYARHKEYVNALRSVQVDPVMSTFLKSKKHCVKFDRYCSFKEEKQTDVAFAVRVIADCLTNGVERVILVTADSDQVPTVAALLAMAPQIEISLACPPGRLAIARELTPLVHDFREIGEGRIEASLFPQNVRDAQTGKVVARRPKVYNPP